ncbi:hypothetical protein BDL97_14G062800, partial [Sphagnum fallax]
LPSAMVGVAVVVGAGPGLGLAIARRFAHEKYTVAILSRDLEKLTKMVEDIIEMEKSGQVCAICINCANSKSVKEAFEAVNSLGPVEALVYNANMPFPWPPPKFTQINAESFKCSITIPCVGAFLFVQQVIQGMVERQKGNHWVRHWGEYQPQGIHVAHIIGFISSAREEDTMMKPDTIAEIYWHVHSQHKSAWTHELDVCPFPEKF